MVVSKAGSLVVHLVVRKVHRWAVKKTVLLADWSVEMTAARKVGSMVDSRADHSVALMAEYLVERSVGQ
jgi:hypothetical protein